MRRLVLAGIVGVLLVELAIALTASSRSEPEAARAAAPRLAAGVLLDKRLGRLGLIDERGRPTSLAAFHGRYLVLAPSLTLCHEVCPLTTAALVRLRRSLRAEGLGRRVVVAQATVDPWRDSPARIRAFKRRTGVDVRFLTGTRAQIRRLWGALGVEYHRVAQPDPPDRDWLTGRPERFDVTHTDGLFIIDPRGHWRVLVPGMPMTAGRLPARLASLLDAAGRRNARRPDTPWNVADVRDDLRALMGLPPAAVPAPAPALAPVRSSGDGLASGGPAAFRARLGSLRGHPVVVNAWASWCPPCREELPLLRAAAARDGTRVAFLGLDVEDRTGAARRFLAAHPVGYPSYEDPGADAIRALAGFAGVPTTVFLGADGRVVAVHTGQYAGAAALRRDIARYALAAR